MRGSMVPADWRAASRSSFALVSTPTFAGAPIVCCADVAERIARRRSRAPLRPASSFLSGGTEAQYCDASVAAVEKNGKAAMQKI
jgi:hypothetical protein